MSEDGKITHLREYKDRIDAERREKRALKLGGSDGTFDGMEARVSQLEKRYDRLETKLDANTTAVTDLRIGMATLTERVSHLPSKGWAVGIAVTTIDLLATIVTLAPKLQQVFGIISK